METTRTLKASGAVPAKTVRASPTMPGFTCASGKMGGALRQLRAAAVRASEDGDSDDTTQGQGGGAHVPQA